MYKIIQIKSGKLGWVDQYLCNDLHLKIGDTCIIEADRGKDNGKVVSEIKTIENLCQCKEIKKVIRKANYKDLEVIERNKKDEEKAYKIFEEKIAKSKLEMKIVHVEYLFDKSKVICYFKANGRVDFRELVKDLASAFRIRVELKQIGVRDEARILTGIGRCGRELCCCAFLKRTSSISIKMAKHQRLPLTPSRISGECSRLMCCLVYEEKGYCELANKMPFEGTEVEIAEGKGVVVDVNIIKQTVVVQVAESGLRVEVGISAIKKMGPRHEIKQEEPLPEELELEKEFLEDEQTE